MSCKQRSEINVWFIFIQECRNIFIIIRGILSFQPHAVNCMFTVYRIVLGYKDFYNTCTRVDVSVVGI